MSNFDQHPHQSGSGSFFSGAIFGAVAGVAGYFLFATEEGKRARQKLHEEWELAKGHLVEEGVITEEEARKDLPHMLQHTIQRMVEPAKRRVTTSTELKKPSRKKTNRFKGV